MAIRTVLVDHKQVKMRLAEIDAPESRQDYGQRAKQALSNPVFGKVVLVDDEGKDRYGRTIGRVHLGGVDVNAKLISTGYAWDLSQVRQGSALVCARR